MGEKHTPAPWKIFMFGGVQIGSAETSEAVCTMWGTEEEGQANAALIVRAVNRDALLDEMVRIGEGMATTLFNLKQSSTLCAVDRVSMERLQTEWDATLAKLREAGR